MAKFPVDAPKVKVIKALEKLGFRLVREGNHMPNHRILKSSTLRTILSQSGISRDEFLKAYEV